MTNQQTQADKATGQTFGQKPDSATGSPANRARQAAKQLRLAAHDGRLNDSGRSFMLCVAQCVELLGQELPQDPTPHAGGGQA